MRVLSFVLFILLGSISAFAQQKQEQEIKGLLRQESDYFYNRDFKGWSSCYLNSPQTYWSCIEKGDVVLEAIGWKAIDKFVGDYIAANPDKVKITIKNENFQFRKMGNAYWVTYDETQITEAETKKLRSIRIVERVGNSWKIVYMNSYPQPA
jgi:hypothetical protein